MSHEKTIAALDQLNIDLNQLAWMIRQVHWYMRDNGFLYYHPLMDDWKDEIDEQIDIVAERIITIGGDPTATLAEMAEKTQLKDTPMDWETPVHDQLKALLVGYQKVNEVMKEALEAAESENDTGTDDFLSTMIGDTEKRIWMIQAELKQAPGV